MLFGEMLQIGFIPAAYTRVSSNGLSITSRAGHLYRKQYKSGGANPASIRKKP
jgi:hypothetical protein